MIKKKDKIIYNKKILRTYFLIVNLVLAMIAFSYLIGCVDLVVAAGETCTVNPVTGERSCSGGSTNPANSDAGAPAMDSESNSNTGNSGWDYNSGLPTADDFSIAPGSTPNPVSGSGGTGSNPSVADGSALGQFNGATDLTGGFGGTNIQPSAGGRTGGVVGGSGTSGTPGTTPGSTIPNYNGNDQTNGQKFPWDESAPTTAGAISDYFDNLIPNLGQLLVGTGIGALVGQFAGGKNGIMWGTIAGASGVLTYQLVRAFMGSAPNAGLYAGLAGIGVFLAIFLLTYKKENTEIVEFHCLPWQAPIGGADCEKCNNYQSCDVYACKSLGQACDLVNKGTTNQKCVWKNPHDTNSPIIEMLKVSTGHKFIPDTTIRPPATGVEIKQSNNACIKAFTPLSFTFATNEPAQCKIDYKLTSDSKTAFDSMAYYVGGNPVFDYNHTETLSLPGPANLGNQSNPEIKNDGTYTLYVRCQDANGNWNVDPFSVRFCVDKGPDTTPPIIVNTSIPSGSPVQFNLSSVNIEVYVNEPADCKWSHEDRDYDNMENNMQCNNQIWEMNNQETYTCRADLTGLQSRTTNSFYFRCKDNPYLEESQRNVNKQSFLYTIIGTQPLNILSISPSNETISNATNYIPAFLEVRTDNGYNNGEAICYYSVTGNETGYVSFAETGGNVHRQRQDLITGNYLYYIKCVDLGGNAVYNTTRFKVETDTTPPAIIRTYKESGQLKIITSEKAECSYSETNCNFEIDIGIKMTTLDYLSHNADWKINKNYYIRCRDKYNNQPNPNACSIVLKPTNIGTKTDVIVL